MDSFLKQADNVQSMAQLTHTRAKGKRPAQPTPWPEDSGVQYTLCSINRDANCTKYSIVRYLFPPRRPYDRIQRCNSRAAFSDGNTSYLEEKGDRSTVESFVLVDYWRPAGKPVEAQEMANA